MTTMMSLPLNALRLGYRVARPPLRLVEDVTASDQVSLFSYRCDRLAAHLLRDESLLFVDTDSSKLIRLHDYRDRLHHRKNPS
jgi:hypothetical protein